MARSTRKRTLVEADLNALRESSNNKHRKRYPEDDNENAVNHNIGQRDKKRTDYEAKDNGKLRILLQDRGQRHDGTREEMIRQRHESRIDYGLKATNELIEMLKRQGRPYYGPRHVKIERLRQDDELDEHSGDYMTGILCGKKDAAEWFLELAVAKEESIARGDYTSMKGRELSDLLEERGLPTIGTKSTQVKRLEEDDR